MICLFGTPLPSWWANAPGRIVPLSNDSGSITRIDSGPILMNEALSLPKFHRMPPRFPPEPSLARAVLDGAGLTHRVITVTGQGIAKPANLLVPVGVALSEVLDYCGGLTDDAAKIFMGGPMMGNTVSNFDLPITKGISGITVLAESQLDRRPERPCLRCAKCVDHCPIKLNPTGIAHAVKLREFELARQLNLEACVECACCGYICPSRIPLVQYMRSGKAALRQIDLANKDKG